MSIDVASEHFPTFHNPLGFLSGQTIEHQQWESACSAFHKEMFWESLQRWAAPNRPVQRRKCWLFSWRLVRWLALDFGGNYALRDQSVFAAFYCRLGSNKNTCWQQVEGRRLHEIPTSACFSSRSLSDFLQPQRCASGYLSCRYFDRANLANILPIRRHYHRAECLGNTRSP